MLRFQENGKKRARMGKGRYLTFEQRKLIEKYANKSFNGTEISKIVGISKSGVNRELRRCGRDLYNAEQAQSESDMRLSEKYNKLSKENKGKVMSPIPQYLKRIENLEMQVEILHDTIKELLKK
jgi:IS30 family transposase